LNINTSQGGNRRRKKDISPARLLRIAATPAIQIWVLIFSEVNVVNCIKVKPTIEAPAANISPRVLPFQASQIRKQKST